MISVIVPVYNSEDTLRPCVESILSQSFTDFELILVNDGSTDLSGRICDECAAFDARVRVKHQANGGRTRARHEGVKLSRGEWVTFVDSDDALATDALRLLSGRATADVDIVFGNGYTLPCMARDFIPMAEFRHRAVRGEGTIGVPWGSFYRRTLLSDYVFDLPRDIYMGEDYIYWLRMVFATDLPVAVVQARVYDKGPEHTSNVFQWTADYCARLHGLRLSAIPAECHGEYMHDMIADRLVNLFSVAVCQSRSHWAGSAFYQSLMADIRACHYSLTLKQRLFLHCPSRRIRKLYSLFS